VVLLECNFLTSNPASQQHLMIYSHQALLVLRHILLVYCWSIKPLVMKHILCKTNY